MAKNNNAKNMREIIDFAIKTKRFVGGLGKLKKNGRIVRLNGQIFKRKTGKSGEEYVVIDNFFHTPRKGTTKRWQMVLLKNLISLNENHWRHTRVA